MFSGQRCHTFSPTGNWAAAIEILIVDDHAFIHESLTAVVQKAVTGAIVHVAGSLEGAIAQARGNAQLGLVLLDLGLPGCAGIESLARFRAVFPKLRVAVVSANEDAACVYAAFAAGAVGFIPKTTPPAVMAAAVRLVAEGGNYFPPQIMAAPPVEARKIDLTGRQAAMRWRCLRPRGAYLRRVRSQLRGIENDRW